MNHEIEVAVRNSRRRRRRARARYRDKEESRVTEKLSFAPSETYIIMHCENRDRYRSRFTAVKRKYFLRRGFLYI